MIVIVIIIIVIIVLLLLIIIRGDLHPSGGAKEAGEARSAREMERMTALREVEEARTEASKQLFHFNSSAFEMY